MTLTTRLMLAGLFGLAALFAFWFGHEGWHAIAIFCGPPLLLAAFGWNGGQKPAFWAGLFALAWFSHGVMVAWSRPLERELALIEIALSLLIVLAVSLPGLRARFGAKR
ncbi:DUF2069 domain-containing protein [Lysobacter sp. KIS68-7]|uniref:DUF2069 domain-containing protein n=1 Tax=Lysobacter sp. KIS68-7 TaxID=2904252 RepID=UPI001E57D9B1|nr:DUF2069 domain-containing protein [Lysobacter sp. KIS68-7]UHQ20967.1 DUF2069 domain-containing protein [Lysobacter sp. KIS68-7]